MKSCATHGTLAQLRNLIRRINVSQPKAAFDECEDFFVLVIESYARC